MNRDESFALFAKGRDAWNDWAEKRFDEREKLAVIGSWVDSLSESDWNDETRAWHAATATDFSSSQFLHLTNFSDFVFPGSAVFDQVQFIGPTIFDRAMFTGNARFQRAVFMGDTEFHKVTFTGGARFGGANFNGNTEFGGATFAGVALFDRAKFTGDARFGGVPFTGPALFDRATFTGEALFARATFTRNARFSGATFMGRTLFSGATFREDAEFLQAVFEGYTAFNGAKFESSVDFGAIEAKRLFSLAGTTFVAVPDFIQAHFAEAPRLDDSHIESRRFRPITQARIKDSLKGDPNLAACWRALKRLAIQGHDHAREQTFFKGELKARRWSEDMPWHAVFWFGLVYQVLSDFGRSILRPFLWWGASVVGFAGLYLGQHPTLAKESWSTVRWLFQSLTDPSGEMPPLTCIAGPGEPWVAALHLSVQKGLLLPGLVPINKLNQIYACLYGILPTDAAQPGQLPTSFSPVIPDGVMALGFLQQPLSAVLIFLLLLAIRNHFRIK
jgi:hypothetical protein